MQIIKKSDAQSIHLPLLPLVSCERKHKDTGQCMVQESIYAAAMAVNNDRILRLCENCDFLAAKAKYCKECYLQYMKKAKQNEGLKNKGGISKVRK